KPFFYLFQLVVAKDPVHEGPLSCGLFLWLSLGATTAVNQTTKAGFISIFQQHNKNSRTKQPHQSSNHQANSALAGPETSGAVRLLRGAEPC
ncbi:hypothetical protein, partial [Aeromonas caviae]|uniref:hypothetical protein n=1 Tax=Aeromonas caviae TaxID=648 RepID=UPI0028E08273